MARSLIKLCAAAIAKPIGRLFEHGSGGLFRQSRTLRFWVRFKFLRGSRIQCVGDARRANRTRTFFQDLRCDFGVRKLAERRMNLRFYDAHNHLQDDRFGGRQTELLAACRQAGIARMVVNGACEADWPQVLALARSHPEVLPSFGYHPWYLSERTAGWRENLIHFLGEIPAAVGEIGLDRWKPGLSYDGQEEAFIAQLRLAAERNLPVSIHCLQAWGRMLEILKAESRPACGFLLHSYGGSLEMVESFAKLGGYFSLPGYYAQERKVRQRETFRQIPLERLLIETDAPDQMLPPGQGRSLNDPVTGKAINHPANLVAVYQFASELRGLPLEILAPRVEENFARLFGRVQSSSIVNL
jgi:TatD DNase family protein